MTFNASVTYPDLRIFEYSGIDQNSPLDVAVGNSGTGTTTSSGSATTTYANDLLVAGNFIGGGTTAPGGGFTQRLLTSPNADIAEDEIISSVGTYAATASQDQNLWYVMQMAAFKAANAESAQPSMPTNISASAISSSQINVGWSASTDSVGVTGYFVVRCQGIGCTSFEQVGSTSSTSFSDTGLSASTSYSYAVQATDAAGNLSFLSGSATTVTGSGSLQGTISLPSAISWTPSSHGSSSYLYTMQFAYGAAPGTQGYVAGSPISNASVLSNITITNAGTTVKYYSLGYTLSPTTGHELLTSVTECTTSSQSDCLLPTSLSYQGESANSAGVVNSMTATGSSSVALANTIQTADIDGDGRQDLIFATADGTGVYYWWVQLASAAGGFAAPIPVGFTTSSSGANIVIDDFMGSGKSEILAQSGAGAAWYAYQFNPSNNTFTQLSTSISTPSGALFAASADSQGVGLPDFFYINSTGFLYKISNTSSGSLSFSTSSALQYTSPVCGSQSIASFSGNNSFAASAVKHLDFNGDGRQDLIVRCANGVVHPLLAQANDYQLSPSILNVTAMLPLNWNGDGCTDLAMIISGSLELYVSGCGEFPTSPTLTFSGYSAIAGALDWNGDGQTDLLVLASGGTSETLIQSPAAGATATPVATSISSSQGASLVVLDADGDGMDDIANMSASSGIVYGLHTAAGTVPDLLMSVTDGDGTFAKPSYVTLTQGAGTAGVYQNLTDATSGYKNYIGALSVVKQVTLSDPTSTSGTYQTSYSYSGAWMNLQGRGFSGFQTQGFVDSRTGFYDVSSYRRDFPYTGMLSGHLLQQSNANGANNVQNVTATLASTTLDSTADNERYVTYISASSTSVYEYGGSENGQLITSSSTSNTVDNFGNPLTTSTTLTDQDPNSPYHGQTWTTATTNTPDADSSTNWCVTLSTGTQTAYTSTNAQSASVTRTKAFTPDLTNCRYSQIVTEPGSATYKVTEVIGYDAFGNLASDQVTPLGMASRTTSIAWGATGQFRTVTTDPSGANTLRCYDSTWGRTISQTDPNGYSSSTCPTTNAITAKWSYDGFGRLSTQTNPDGTSTTWSYQDCASDGGCIIGSHALVASYTNRDNTGASISAGAYSYDPVGRVLQQTGQLLGTATQQRDYRYDSVTGQVALQSAPCAVTGNPVTPCSTSTSTTISYDPLGRVSSVVQPLSGGGSATTSVAYAGRTLSTTDANGNTTKKIIDVNGWLRQTSDANPNPNTYSVTLYYDAAGSQTSAKDGSGRTLSSHTYAYGMAPFVTASTDARGTWSYTPDALGEVKNWVDAKGQAFSANYDVLSRMTDRYEPDFYTHWTWGSSASSDNIGKLQSVCTGLGTNPTACTSSGYTESDTYDSLTRPSQRSIAPTPLQTFVYSYQYDPHSGFLSTLTYPIGGGGYALTLQYAYSNGYLQSITDTADGIALWSANAMNPAGQVSSESLGNALFSSHTYDPLSARLTAATAGPTAGSASSLNLGFMYDNVGNLTQRQDNNRGLTENFYYYNNYTLHYSTLGGNQNLGLTYNPDGGIATKADSGPNLQSYTASYTSYNLPSLISTPSESVTFAYGPNRERIQQNYNNGAELTYYVGGLFEQVFPTNDVENDRYYVYAGSEPVAVISRRADVSCVSYLLADHQGSVAAIVNASGTTDESFSSFGVTRNANTWSGSAINNATCGSASVTRQGYTFQTTLGQSMGMNHMNGRVQDAITGRFLSPDPVVADPSNPQSYNQYAYVMSSPLSLVDPTGFDADEPPTYTGSLIPGVTGFSPEGCIGNCGAFSDATTSTNGYNGTYNGNTFVAGACQNCSSPASSSLQTSGSATAAVSGSAGSLGLQPIDSGNGSTSAASEPTNSLVVPAATNLDQVVVTAYQGYFHDALVNQLFYNLVNNGYVAEKEFGLCFRGSCTRADLFYQSERGLIAVEVKTGESPDWTDAQLAVYPHLYQGGLVTTPDPGAALFGLPVGAPLPPVTGFLFYQLGPGTTPTSIPFPFLFPPLPP